jgi:hypothetical protein
MPKVQTNVLTPREAEAVRLHEEKGLTWAEMAAVTGMGAANCQDAYRKASRKLKRIKEGEQSGAVLHGRSEGEVKKLGVVTDQMISERMDRMIIKGLYYLEHHPEIWARAGVRELTQAIASLTEKRQLLRGEATSIVRHEDVRTLDDLTNLVKNELERRQRAIDADPLVGRRGDEG